ncbi:MAG TPA: Fic family protein, partial [Tepidisphaeraceae bacterium]|nr:Fic family protein [Tepidisphaeraceae bacterium]
MQDPLFLTLEDVLEIHAYQVEQLGHDPTVLEIQKLESAIAQPKQVFGGAYLFHICQNHAFADG